MATLRDRLTRLEVVQKAKPPTRESLHDQIKQSRARLQRMFWECWDAGRSVAGPPTSEDYEMSKTNLLAALKRRRQLTAQQSTTETTP